VKARSVDRAVSLGFDHASAKSVSIAKRNRRWRLGDMHG
jgi:hypothetical protein